MPTAWPDARASRQSRRLRRAAEAGKEAGAPGRAVARAAGAAVQPKTAIDAAMAAHTRNPLDKMVAADS